MKDDDSKHKTDFLSVQKNIAETIRQIGLKKGGIWK
jgi:hypothetical protein